MSECKRLTLRERVAIEAGLEARHSFHRIARKLGRPTSTVIREVKANRLCIPVVRPNGRNCAFAPECMKHHLCGDQDCSRRCWTCREKDCTRLCSRCVTFHCPKLDRPPYVCNLCYFSHKKKCRKDRCYYIAEKANVLALKRRSESRSGVRSSVNQIHRINSIVSPLVMKGQPISHIYLNHRHELGVSVRTIYNYIDQNKLTVKNLDLRRKVKYRKRRKKPDHTRADRMQYRVGRTYDDYQEYIRNHPDTRVVEMDTVHANRWTGKVLLTMHFPESSFMLIFLLDRSTQEKVREVFDWLTERLGLYVFQNLFPVFLTDNGGEFKGARDLEFTMFGMPRTKLFYCDPRASWQKPHIEKNHEFIRYVLPKGQSFNDLTQEKMSLLASHINSIARDSLKGRTPFELVESKDMQKLLALLGMSPVAADDICLTPELIR